MVFTVCKYLIGIDKGYNAVMIFITDIWKYSLLGITSTFVNIIWLQVVVN